MEMPYEKKFKELPNTNGKDIADYFNLEFGLEFDENAKKYTEDDFRKIGMFLNAEGVETIYWSVSGKVNLWAVVQPYDGSSILSMSSEDPKDLKETGQ